MKMMKKIYKLRLTIE